MSLNDFYIFQGALAALCTLIIFPLGQIYMYVSGGIKEIQKQGAVSVVARVPLSHLM